MAVFQYTSLDEVPNDFRGEAKEKDGKFELNLVSNSKLEEFRNKNIQLTKSQEELANNFKKIQELFGDNPEEFKKQAEEWRQTHEEVATGKIVKAEGVAEAVSKRTRELSDGFNKERDGFKESIKKLADENSRLSSELRESIIDRAVFEAVSDTRSGARSDAFADIKERAKRVFKVNEDRHLIPYEDDAILYGTDGTTPMNMREWLTRLRDAAPYFFQDTSGGGAAGSDRVIAGGSKIRSKADFKSVGEKTKFIREHGQGAYEKLPMGNSK